MMKLNTYITEAWSGMKQRVIKEDKEAWCEEMGIINYTINSQDEIDVDGSVHLRNKKFKEVPYKFGRVSGDFNIDFNIGLISLKNCPNEVGGYFSCQACRKLTTLEGAPQKVGDKFFCSNCKRKFTEEEVESLCEVKKENIYV